MTFCSGGAGSVIKADFIFSTKIPLLHCPVNKYSFGYKISYAFKPDKYVVLNENWCLSQVWKSIRPGNISCNTKC